MAGFSLKKNFATTSITPMHLKLDGEKCYAPKEVNKEGVVLESDYDKPIEFNVHSIVSEHGKKVTRQWSRAKSPLEHKVKKEGRDKTDAEIEESDAMFYNYVASLVDGWNNIDEKYSHSECREFLADHFDVAQQVLSHAGSTVNYRKK